MPYSNMIKPIATIIVSILLILAWGDYVEQNISSLKDVAATIMLLGVLLSIFYWSAKDDQLQ